MALEAKLHLVTYNWCNSCMCDTLEFVKDV
jgi:hypothetical protein